MTPNLLTAIAFRCSISAVFTLSIFAPNAQAQNAATQASTTNGIVHEPKSYWYDYRSKIIEQVFDGDFGRDVDSSTQFRMTFSPPMSNRSRRIATPICRPSAESGGTLTPVMTKRNGYGYVVSQQQGESWTVDVDSRFAPTFRQYASSLLSTSVETLALAVATASGRVSPTAYSDPGTDMITFFANETCGSAAMRSSLPKISCARRWEDLRCRPRATRISCGSAFPRTLSRTIPGRTRPLTGKWRLSRIPSERFFGTRSGAKAQKIPCSGSWNNQRIVVQTCSIPSTRPLPTRAVWWSSPAPAAVRTALSVNMSSQCQSIRRATRFAKPRAAAVTRARNGSGRDVTGSLEKKVLFAFSLRQKRVQLAVNSVHGLDQTIQSSIQRPLVHALAVRRSSPTPGSPSSCDFFARVSLVLRDHLYTRPSQVGLIPMVNVTSARNELDVPKFI